MGTDLEIVLDCSAAAARIALRRRSPDSDDASVEDSVTAIGPRASRTRTHFRFPLRATSDDWDAIAAYVLSFAQDAGHGDARGVLVVPETLELSARSYRRFVDLTGGQGRWVQSDGALARGADTPAAERRTSTALKRAPERPLPRNTRLACLVLPRAGVSTDGSHAAIAAKASLADGTVLVVVRELFSDPEAILRYVLHYPRVATLATDARGLLAIPASAYAAACRLRSYDEVVAEHVSKTKKSARDAKPGHYWLKVSDLEALRRGLDGSRDDAYLASLEQRSSAAKNRASE